MAMYCEEDFDYSDAEHQLQLQGHYGRALITGQRLKTPAHQFNPQRAEVRRRRSDQSAARRQATAYLGIRLWPMHSRRRVRQSHATVLLTRKFTQLRYR